MPLTTITVVAGCVVAVGSAPASAQTSQTAASSGIPTTAIPTTKEQLCLSSAAGACIGVPVNDIIEGAISAADAAGTWLAIYLTLIKKGSGDGGQEGEEKDTGAAGDGDPDAGLCLTSNNSSEYVYMGPCGANGTTWIAVPHGKAGDYFLKNTFWYRNGRPNYVLAASSDARGTRLIILPDTDNSWRTWSYYSTSHK